MKRKKLKFLVQVLAVVSSFPALAAPISETCNPIDESARVLDAPVATAIHPAWQLERYVNPSWTFVATESIPGRVEVFLKGDLVNPQKTIANRGVYVIREEWKCQAASAQQAGSGGSQVASYVGRWAHKASWCHNKPGTTDELPITLTARGMEGLESSCRFDRVRGGSGRWDISMTCDAEGTRTRERIEVAVDGSKIQITNRRKRAAPRKLTRCP